ncbi:MAG: insulinase family protein [Candidatus Rokubacteria bacterium]|nr:insulinase family protein [Candidatus Rokubacteria bacterium]
MTKHLLSLLALVAWLGGCAAQGALKPSSADEAGLPLPFRQVLPNGMRLIIQDHRAADVVAVYLFVGVGGRDEGPNELGFSHFQEHMLFKGTDTQGPGFVDREVEGVGGRSNANTSLDYTFYYLVVPTQEMPNAIRILADMAFRSKFDPAELSREGDVILEEGRIEIDNPRTALVRGLYGLVFRDHPYGRPILGTRETLKAATRENVLAYYKRHYVPENVTLVVVGPVAPGSVNAAVRETFGRSPATGHRRAPVPGARPLSGGIRREVERPEQQAYLALGWLAPRADDSDGFAVDMLASILGGTESSRLARKLRDQDRLVSSITMSYAALVGGGIVSVRAELEAGDLDKVERLILEEIARVQESGVTEEERQIAVTHFEAEHAFDTETAEGLAYAYGIAETTWSLEEELRYVERIRQVTREQIRDVARRYLSRTDYARLAFVPRSKERR